MVPMREPAIGCLADHLLSFNCLIGNMPDFRNHYVYNRRLLNFILRHQTLREPVCAVIIAVGSTNLTLIRKLHFADGYTAAVTMVGLSSWICATGMVFPRWL